MAISYNKIRVTVDLAAIRHNYRLLNDRGGAAIPVVKADAYGHGLIEVARTLEGLGVGTFAVGTVEEALDLLDSGVGQEAVSLLGPMDPEEYEACFARPVIPFVGSLEQLSRLEESRPEGGRVRLGLKFDTGMARLGFSPDQAARVAAWLVDRSWAEAAMVSSHLAAADEPDQAEFTREQNRCLRSVLAALEAGGVRAPANLANSAGVLGHAECGHQAQRVGIAMYGANPFHGTDQEDLGGELRPAMSVDAPVVQVREIASGTTVSYGRTFRADRDMRIALVAAGYADCYSRGLSGRGFMEAGGERRPILGRVCMQLTAIDATGLDLVPGDRVHLLGGQGESAIRPEELSQWWGTIPYEVFCLLGMNRKFFKNP